MRKVVLLISFVLLSQFTKAQKLYVFCPDVQEIKPRVGFLDNENVNVVIFDGRQIPKKIKTDCTSEGFVNSLLSVLKTSYPSVHINVLNESEYYKKADSGVITIKIGVSAYHAGYGLDVGSGLGGLGGNIGSGLFVKAQWNAITAYSVKIFDLRTQNKAYNKEIQKVDSKSNLWGYKSAKQALATSYTSANQELLFFIDNSLMQ